MSASRWREVPLKDVLAQPIRNGYSPLESQEWTGVQMLGLGCLTPEGFDPRQLKNAPASVSATHSAILRDGDLLLSRANTRDLVGLPGIYRDVGNPCIYPDLMMRLNLQSFYSPRFLEVLLRSPRLRRRITARAQGTSESMVKISGASIADLRVPLVPLAEQRRVVDALTTLTEEERAIESTIAKLRTVSLGAVMDLLGRSRWDLRLSDALNGAPRNGYSPTATANWTGVQMLGLGCLTPEGFQPRQLKNAPESVRPGHYAMLQHGDLLMSRANTRELVGLAGIYQDIGTPCIYPDLMMRLSVAEGRSAQALEIVLRSPRARSQISGLAQGTSESMVKISGKSVQAVRIPDLSISEQAQLISVADGFGKRIAREEEALAKLRSLKQGLTDDLLSGKVRLPDVA